MESRAAILWHVGDAWSVERVTVDAPGPGEVRVRIEATGLCHSDDHAVTGDSPMTLPVVGGHEGAGIVESVGAGVTRVEPGDHVVLVFNPPCGDCLNCARGRTNLCLNPPRGDKPCGTCENCRHGRPSVCTQAVIVSPVAAQGVKLGRMARLGTFADYATVSERSAIKIPDEIPFAAAALLGCAVTTGWGSAVYLGEVKPGDTVVVIGAGGIGINAVQGARNAGADIICALDPVEFKRQQALTFGATHTAASVDEVLELLRAVSPGRMADVAIISVGVGNLKVVTDALEMVGRGGFVVINSVAPSVDEAAAFPLGTFSTSQKTLRGNSYGGVSVYRDIPLLLGLYSRGHLKLDELITQTYPLEEINLGYADMKAGKNLRGVVLLGA